MHENIKLIIKNEYENGTSMSVLSKKYNIGLSRIKKWSSEGKWIKKKQNKVTKSKSNRTKKSNQKQMVTLSKETQIKSDIINNLSKKEIIEKNDISESTYYRNKKSVRAIQIEQSEKILRFIAEEKYSDAKERLIKISEQKEELEKKLLDLSIDEKDKMQLIMTRLSLLREFEKEIKNGARVINDYRRADLEQQLENENLIREKIDLERNKNGKIEDEEQVVIIDDTDKN
nr:MAG TPA: hypothetical protein [Caudoviricetes sp.]